MKPAPPVTSSIGGKLSHPALTGILGCCLLRGFSRRAGIIHAVPDTFPLAANRLAFYLLLAFLLSAVAARGLAGIAARVGLIDMPGGRKQHAAPVPVIGGIAQVFRFLAAALQGLGTQTALLLMLTAAIAGFLVWNLRLPGRTHARVFMGDTGAMMLGLALCWFTIDVTQGERRTMPPVVCVWILAVPLLDMARVMFLRLLRRTDVFDGDREHLHHYLIARGYSVSRTVAILMAASAVTGAIGIGAWQLGVPDWVMFYLFAALAATVLQAAYTRARG